VLLLVAAESGTRNTRRCAATTAQAAHSCAGEQENATILSDILQRLPCAGQHLLHAVLELLSSTEGRNNVPDASSRVQQCTITLSNTAYAVQPMMVRVTMMVTLRGAAEPALLINTLCRHQLGASVLAQCARHCACMIGTRSHPLPAPFLQGCISWEGSKQDATLLW
jgi:hypothetical protein